MNKYFKTILSQYIYFIFIHLLAHLHHIGRADTDICHIQHDGTMNSEHLTICSELRTLQNQTKFGLYWERDKVSNIYFSYFYGLLFLNNSK